MTTGRGDRHGRRGGAARRGHAALAAGLVALLTLSGCATTTPAREALAGEPLAWEQVDGAEVLEEAVVDGSSGGLLGKPARPTVSRHLVPTDGSTPDELLTRVVELSVEQGWEARSRPGEEPYRAGKTLDAGPATLLVSVRTDDPPARVVLTMSTP